MTTVTGTRHLPLPHRQHNVQHNDNGDGCALTLILSLSLTNDVTHYTMMKARTTQTWWVVFDSLLAFTQMFASMAMISMIFTCICSMSTRWHSITMLSWSLNHCNISQQEAVTYITLHIRSHAMSLNMQTIKGNYLTSLSIWTASEQVIFSDEATWDQLMNDLVLNAAIWHDEYWVN